MATGDIKQIAIGDDIYNIYDATARSSITNIQKKQLQTYTWINSAYASDRQVNAEEAGKWKAFGGGHLTIKWSDLKYWGSFDGEQSKAGTLWANAKQAYLVLGTGFWAAHYKLRLSITDGNVGAGITYGIRNADTAVVAGAGNTTPADERLRFFFYNPVKDTYIQCSGPIVYSWSNTRINADDNNVNYNFYHSAFCSRSAYALSVTYTTLTMALIYFGIGNSN